MNEDGKYRYDSSNRLQSIGMISGAVFSDVNSDGWPDLILAREWNTPLLLINNEGTFSDATESWGLSSYYGLWNGVNTGDFNNDGRMDLVLTNAGKNNKYYRFIRDSGKEVRLFYYSYAAKPTSIIEAGYSNELRGWVPFRRLKQIGK
ncbi:MAG: VCBS repeat-containing protein [Balneolaceae bacterium]|nr:VCBS repeat-containing protein [Balneolaceae bacterium]